MSFMMNLFQIIPDKIPPLSLFHQAHSDETFGRHQNGSGRPCRACTDFQNWIQANKPQQKQNNPQKQKNHQINNHGRECPLDKDELGRNSWSLLHTMSVYYPDRPTIEQQTQMKHFISGLAAFYPCEACRLDFQKDIKEDPPNTESRKALGDWWCRIHNRVNRKLGKPEFDCNKITERWLDGWSDGSCD